MDLKKEEDASRIHLTQDRDNLRVAANIVVENFLIGGGPISFLRTTLLHLVARHKAFRTLPFVISISNKGQAYSSSLSEVK